VKLDNKFWKCPVKVKRGSYEEMPESWIGAAVSYYVGAATDEEALTKAVSALKSHGMEFVDLLGGKVIQLDPDEWWDGYVMEIYAEHSEHFPDQDAVKKVVLEGSVFHGPFAGWEAST
jgi:hypothetical protein